MPRVPSLEDYSVAATPDSDAHIADTNTAAAFTSGGDQLQKLGNAAQTAGDNVDSIALDMQNRVNQVRVSDGVNQARQKMQDLAYNPQTGYLNLKGGAALQRPNGVALPEEYGQKLTQGISDIAATLGNDEQKRMFGLQANELHTSFTGDVERHMLGEFQNYHASVAKGQMELSTQDAELNWNNPKKIDQAINGVVDDKTGVQIGGIKQSIYQQAQVSGLSANETQAAMNNAESGVHAKVVDAALLNNNVSYANQYFQTNKGKMQADDILSVQAKLTHQLDAQMSLGAVTNTTQKYQPQMAPSDMDRLNNVVVGMESNGRETDANGNILTSSKGAQGSAQVMPATQADPGYGVKPAQLTGDVTADAAERKRAGRDYLQAMLQKYGNTQQALAAYNSGPGSVDDAIAAAKKDGSGDWLSKLPQETQDYVDTGVKRFASGASAPQMPTKEEFVTNALGQLGTNPRVELVTATREQAEKQYDLINTSRKEQGEQALAQAQKELIANGGDFTNLNPTTTSNLSRFDPGKYDDALKFAKSISRGENVTNMTEYTKAWADPSKLAEMSDADFTQYVMTNFSQADGEKLARLRGNILNGKDDESSQSINNKAVNIELNNRLLSIGINPTPHNTEVTERDRVGEIQKFVRDDIFDQQQQLGRKMTPAEITTRVDTLFAKSGELKHWYGNSPAPLLSMKYEDIPGVAVSAIRQAYTSKGVNNVSNDQVLQDYWRWKKRNTTPNG